jgi:hypothetical protein
MIPKTEAAPKLDQRSLLVMLLFGVAGTIQYYLYQFFSGFDRFFGDRGDARGFLYYCEHWYRSLAGKSSLLSPEVFYPAKGTLAYSDLLVGVGVPYSFFRALGVDMFRSLEITIILITFLSYCTAFWLLYKVLEFRLTPSIAGAMFFAFNSPKWFQLIHLQLQFVVLLPIIFGLLIRFARQAQTLDQKRAAILLSVAGLCWDLQIATGLYFAWFFVLWSTFFLLLALAFARSRRFLFALCKKFWRAMLIAAAVLLLGFAPTLLLYLPLARSERWYTWEGMVNLIPDWHSVLWMGAGNYLWGRITLALLPDPIPNTWGELQVGIGLFSSLTWIVLTIATIWFIRARRQSITPAGASSSVPDARDLGLLFLALLILATSLFYVFGFRYSGHSPWYFIYKFFPGGGAIRGVSRYVIFLALPISIAFAYVLNRGLEYASREQTPFRRKALTALMIFLGAATVFEQFGVAKIGGPGFSVRLEKTYLGTLAAQLSPDCQAFYLANGPLATRTMPEYQYDAMMLSALSGIPTLNASSSQFPSGWDLYSLNTPDYEEKVKSWIASQGLKGKICRIVTGPEIDAFDVSYPNPINDPQVFVRQLYRDFSVEQPQNEILESQIKKLTKCGASDAFCQTQTALNIFLATGFHERGSFVLRMYEAGLNRLPTFDEFMDNMTRFERYVKSDPKTAQARMLEDFRVMNVSEGFKNQKPLPELVANEELINRGANRCFVALHYYGFFRRQPDELGLVSWTDMLNRRGEASVVTNGIITSPEYRQRLRLNQLHHVRLDHRYERFSDAFGLVARQNILSAKRSQARACPFHG